MSSNWRIGLEKSILSTKVYLDLTLVSYPNSSRNVGFSYNTLYFINAKGSIVSYDLDQLSRYDPEVELPPSGIIERSGKNLDFTIFNNRLFVVTKNLLIEEVLRDRVRQRGSLVPFIPEGARATVTSISSCKSYIIVAAYLQDKSKVCYQIMNYHLKVVDSLTSGEKSSHIHCLRPIIKKQMTFVIAACRFKYVNLLYIPNDKIIILELNKQLNNGPLDGLCILGDSEALVYEGKHSTFLRILRIV